MRSKLFLGLTTMLSASSALAADVLPVGTLDHQATAGVAKADPTADGEVTLALGYHGRSLLTPARLFLRSDEDSAALLRDASSMGLLMGLGLSQSLDVSVGFHGTDEALPAAQRDRLFPKESASDSGWRGNFRQTGFSGVSLLLKYRLLTGDSWRLALAPFAESGIGDPASDSLTRSRGPKAGLMAIASYGTEGVAALSFNIGWRYRDPETIGETTLRHELFGKALVETDLTRSLRLFLVGEGRRLQIAGAGPNEPKAYQSHAESGTKAGIKLALGETDLTAYWGGRLGKDAMFGYGAREFGVALNHQLGNLNGRSPPKTNYGKQIEAEQASKRHQDRKAAQRPKSFMDEVDAAFPAQGDYSEMNSQASEDVLDQASAGIVDDSDFKAAEHNAAQNRLKDGELSEDDKVRQELEALKAADAQAEQERAALEAREAEAARKVRYKRARENEKLMQEWMDEAQKDAETIPGIGEDDMSWQGLEE